MTSSIEHTCPGCGKQSTATVYNSVNVSESPDLKQKVLNGELFVHECPFCGERTLLRNSFLYHDPEKKIIVCLSDRPIGAEGLEEYTSRRVTDVGTLVEKVKILDAGLDDRAMELCKVITRQELGKSVSLKFFRMDGPDNEITLTYPQDGKMEMLVIGFNVYEDCRGIVGRNPSMEIRGMELVDSAWVEKFIAE